jgi:glycine/D-amino acid oxidase-like deaminating enzyme
MLDRETVQSLFPRIELGPDVTGASFGHHDGHANPLRLLAALQEGIERKGGTMCGGCIVKAIKSEPGGGYTTDFGHGRASAEKIVIAAGLGSKALSAQVDVDVPIRPERGQLLVTERLEPIFPLPMLGLRQTREGTVMIGVTNEEAGFDASTTTAAAAQMSADAVRTFPDLGAATLVRQWAGLRILTPDGFPIYAESASHPGVFVALCHSGVTLAAVHATVLAQAVAGGELPRSLDMFHHRRFDVPQAA